MRHASPGEGELATAGPAPQPPRGGGRFPFPLLALFAGGLAVRLAVAPFTGLGGDLGYFRSWARALASGSLRGFYAATGSDYPPAYMLVLWVAGRVGRALGAATLPTMALKAPAIAADLALAALAGLLAARLAGRSGLEWAAAAAVLLSPAVLAVGAVWGQVDSLPAAAVLGSYLLLFTGRPTLGRELGGVAAFAAAVAVKPQALLALPPVVLALYRRHARGGEGAGLGRLGTLGLAAVAVWAASGIPFGLSPRGMVALYRRAAGTNPVTSAWAFNLWGAAGPWRPDLQGTGALRVGGVPALVVGAAAAVVAVAVVVVRCVRALDRGAPQAQTLVACGAACSAVGFALLTRMHERYLFLALACLAPLVGQRPARRALGALSAFFVVNLYFPYVFHNELTGHPSLRLEPLFSWLYGGPVVGSPQVVWLSVAGTALCLWAAWSCLPGSTVLARRRQRERRAVPPPERPQEPPRLWRRNPALVAPAAAVVFGLVALWPETWPVRYLNDSAFHLQMVRWAQGQIAHGRIPLDGWYPYFALGSSFFHHYQSLPHVLTAYLGGETAYRWSIYLLLAAWPACVYAAGRLLGWERRTSALAAIIAPLVVSAPGYGYEWGTYVWRGLGAWTQLWGMWLLPLAWGLSWRTVASGRPAAAAGLAVAATIAVHFMTGYLALAALAVWALVAAGGVGQRVGRAAMVGALGLVGAAPVLVPLLADARYTNQSAYLRHTTFADSFGARRVLSWLASGQLFDAGRAPLLTALVGVGLAVCLARARRDDRARALLGMWAVSLLLFFGRPTLGPLLRLVPGSGDLQLHRFIMGVHLGGILLAAVGGGWLAGVVARAARAMELRAVTAAAAAGVALGAVLAPAVIERSRYAAGEVSFVRAQQRADRTDGADMAALLDRARRGGGGRLYAGLRANWGRDYKAGYVPAYAMAAERDVDAVGFTFRAVGSLGTDVEALFDEADPSHYEMMNVRWLMLPADRPPPVAAERVARRGRHVLWRVRTTGYLQVVDTLVPIAADRASIASQMMEFLRSGLAAQARYPLVAFDGRPAGRPTVPPGTSPAGSPGRVLRQRHRPAQGLFRGEVEAARPAAVLLKSSFDPRWEVRVDGRRRRALMLAPAFVGVDVPAGRHTVEFRYRPVGSYPATVALALLTLGAGPLRRRLAARARGG